MAYKNKYIGYGKDGKILIISKNKRIVKAYLEKKGER